MRFFFDNNISPKLVAILQILMVDARHLKDDFPVNTDDTDWIPRVGAEGWILVTADKRIRRNPAELAALRANHVTALFLKDTFLKNNSGNRRSGLSDTGEPWSRKPPALSREPVSQ